MVCLLGLRGTAWLFFIHSADSCCIACRMACWRAARASAWSVLLLPASGIAADAPGKTLAWAACAYECCSKDEDRSCGKSRICPGAGVFNAALAMEHSASILGRAISLFCKCDNGSQSPSSAVSSASDSIGMTLPFPSDSRPRWQMRRNSPGTSGPSLDKSNWVSTDEGVRVIRAYNTAASWRVARRSAPSPSGACDVSASIGLSVASASWTPFAVRRMVSVFSA